MMANGRMTKRVDMEFTSKLMEQNMRDIGKMTSRMVMVLNTNLMALRIKAAIKKE